MDPNIYMLLIATLLIALSVFYFLNKSLKAKIQKIMGDGEATKKEFSQYKDHVKHLLQYEVIDDAKAEAKKIVQEAELRLRSAEKDYQSKISEAEKLSSIELKEARSKAKEIRDRAEISLSEAHELAGKIEAEAKSKAKEVAGEAWEAKKNAEQYQATVKAMKNIIKGYGDEYLIPNESILDNLAAEYDHKQAGEDLKKIRSQIKSMIKNGEAADCDYVELHRKTTAIDFVLDAFNGKIDSIMSKVKHDNHGKLLQQMEDAFYLVNHNGKPFRDARITERYYKIMVQQLKAAVAVQEIKRQDIEEQRRIREEIREEERAKREFEKAIKQAEKEEDLLHKAMKEAEAKLTGAAVEEKAKYEAQLLELNERLREAEERGQRALSMAQQTKQGHVYIISNIGSFGENIFKIGLTRRLAPLDRIKELGDASVPFSFDVHAMIHSEDAPKLEKELHAQFILSQVNKVNPRKEFFRVPLTQIKQQIEELGLNAHWTMKAEALEYRESLQLEMQELNESKIQEKLEITGV